MTDFTPRPGEVVLGFDPARDRPDGSIAFIGRIRSPWTGREDCPKNMARARAAGGGGMVEIDAPYRAGLDGLAGFTHAFLLTWLDRSRRDLIVQKPRHAETPRGVFALRSPVRPNPIGLHLVELGEIDIAAGTIRLAAIDVLDGTPLIDIKPYFGTVDEPASGQ